MGEEELPGMREHADTSGGETDSRSGEPFRCSRCRKNSHCQGATVNCDCPCTGPASPAPASRALFPGQGAQGAAQARPRQCYAAMEGECDETGYWPVLVTEGQPGYRPLKGDPAKHQAPWYWGTTRQACMEQCDEVNARDYGLTPRDRADIVLSSVAASMRPVVPEG